MRCFLAVGVDDLLGDSIRQIAVAIHDGHRYVLGAEGQYDIVADVSAYAGHDCDYASGRSGTLPSGKSVVE